MAPGMADRLFGGMQMMVGTARGRSGRQLRFTALVGALVAINMWIWIRLTAGGTSASTVELGLAGIAALLTLGVAIALWRNPFSSHVHMMATPSLRQALATHQAGHIVAAHLSDPTRVRRADLNYPCNHFDAVTPAVSESALRNELVVTIAGIAAEEVFAGESGSHSADDLERATRIGIDMVGRFGMAGSPVSMGVTRSRRLAERVIDDPRTRKELEALLRETKRDATRKMLENRHLVIALRDALVRQSRLDSRQIRYLIAGADRVRQSDDEVLVDLRIVSNRPAAGEM